MPKQQYISPREQRSADYKNFQEDSQRQQQLDTQSQAQMLQMLHGLYGLQQQQQMTPLQMQALQAEIQNRGYEGQQKQFDLAHAQEGFDAKLASEKAVQDYHNRQVGPQLPHEFPYLPQDAQQ